MAAPQVAADVADAPETPQPKISRPAAGQSQTVLIPLESGVAELTLIVDLVPAAAQAPPAVPVRVQVDAGR